MMNMSDLLQGGRDISVSTSGLQNAVVPQSIKVATPGLQSAPRPPFTLSMLSVMPTGADDDAVATLLGPEEESGDTAVSTDAPVMLLQQILDGLLAANTAPVNTAANVLVDVTTPASLPGISSPAQTQTQMQTQTQASTLTDVGALPSMQPVTAKNVEITTPLTVLNAGENVTISTARPEIQAEVVGSETKSFPATLKLEPDSSRWTQQLQSALGERLQVQVKDQIQHATIRLDPPEMGKIEIAVHIENGRLQVTINANQGEVYRALQQVSNDLRQSLTEQNFVQVNVQVSSQNGQRDGQQQSAPQAQPQDVMDAVSIEADVSESREDASILLTV